VHLVARDEIEGTHVTHINSFFPDVFMLEQKLAFCLSAFAFLCVSVCGHRTETPAVLVGYMLHATCYMLHAACCMLHVIYD
jgi:hypothetical protein